jgi:hypothetical protein
MGKKIKSEMDAQRETFVQGAANTNSVPRKQAEEIFEQIDKFAGYGFKRSLWGHILQSLLARLSQHDWRPFPADD